MATDTSQLIEQRLPDNDTGRIFPEDVRTVAHALDAQVPNQRRGGPFFVTFLTQAAALAAGRAGDGSLESLDPALLCLGARARVELHPDGDGVELVLVFDGTGQGLAVALNGNFQRTVAGKWVKADSLEAVNANVPYYAPGFNAPTGYPVAYLVRYAAPGQTEAFYYSKLAGQLPAPTGASSDPNWKVVPGPVAPTALAQSTTLAGAQHLYGNITAGRLYVIDWGLDGQGQPQTVYVQGLSASAFDGQGVLEAAGTRTPVQVDVAAGTFTTLDATAGGALPWAAGKQKGSSLVYNDGAVWRVKADLANSQAGPTHAAPNAQYYEFVGGAELLTVAATQQQHTQQLATNATAIAGLQARGGRMQGAFKAGLTLAPNDMVKYQNQLWCNASTNALTTTATFTGLTLVQPTPFAYPVIGYTAAGAKGYNDLRTANAGGAYGTEIIVASTLISVSGPLGQLVFSLGATAAIGDGVTATMPAGFRSFNTSYALDNTSGVLEIAAGAATVAAAATLTDCSVSVPAAFVATNTDPAQALLVLRGNSRVEQLTGTGTLHLFDAATYGTVGPQVVVVDHRPGASSGGGGTSLITSLGQGFAVVNGQLNYWLDDTEFVGSTGSAQNGLNGYTPPDTQQYRFAPMRDVALDKGGCWDNATNTYVAKRAGIYLLEGFYNPGYPAYDAIGNDFYAGPAKATPAASVNGKWESVSKSTRRGISFSRQVHLAVGERAGMAERQLGSGDSNNTTGYEGNFPAILGLRVILQLPDRV